MPHICNKSLQSVWIKGERGGVEQSKVDLVQNQLIFNQFNSTPLNTSSFPPTSKHVIYNSFGLKERKGEQSRFSTKLVYFQQTLLYFSPLLLLPPSIQAGHQGETFICYNLAYVSHIQPSLLDNNLSPKICFKNIVNLAFLFLF